MGAYITTYNTRLLTLTVLFPNAVTEKWTTGTIMSIVFAVICYYNLQTCLTAHSRLQSALAYLHKCVFSYSVVSNYPMQVRNLKFLSTYRFNSKKPAASEVLTCYLLQCNEPPWTSYFVKYSSIYDDQWGKSHFNWQVAKSNYHILRTGCYPYIKYHCSKRSYQDLEIEDKFFRVIKVVNLGIPCLAYGIAATLLIKHTETVHTSQGLVTIYFLLPEHKGSQY